MSRIEKARPDAVALSEQEILRYLGYGQKQAEAEVLHLVHECRRTMEAGVSYKACYDVLPVTTQADGRLSFGPITVYSEDLLKNLASCRELIMFTATIGMESERLLQKYSLLSPTHAVIAQAVGAGMIEAWCDHLCERFGNMVGEGKCLRPRFSPGYGDLDLAVQKEIFAFLDCPRQIGVSLTESLLMLPSKSVSALVGIAAE
ncbi:MAG: Vitamin B12 dependent methionine synthase activation subunit [Ruminococcaceae bacterium]|nr:Vitamin B12 dependent methionine synthase activation subunit [Oscillospiraceae bacterium]